MARSTKRPGFRPALENLEDRLTPSSFKVTGSTLKITGDDPPLFSSGGTNTVSIQNNGNGRITFSLDGGASQTLNGIKTINIDTKGGNDTVTFKQTGDQQQSLTVNTTLGSGTDSFFADMQGRDVKAGTLAFHTTGGNDGDSLRVKAQGTDIATGAKLTVDLNGSDSFALFDAADTIDVAYRGQLKGRLDVDTAGGLGDDTITVKVDLLAGSTGKVGTPGDPARMTGDAGSDTLTFIIAQRNAGDPATFSAQMDGGFLGTDRGTHSQNVVATGLEQETIRNVL